MIPKLTLPKHKSDEEAAQKIAATDPLLHLKECISVMEWCLDPNWPVSAFLYPWLSKMGQHLLSPLNHFANLGDYNGVYTLIGQVIYFVPEVSRPAFIPLLTQFSTHPSRAQMDQEVDVIARETLNKWCVKL